MDLSFTVHRDDYAKALALTRAAIAPYSRAAVEGDDRVAKLAVVGSGMRSHAGVAARLFETLGLEGINVRLVSTSEIKVSVLVAESDLERAVRALHAAYKLDKSPSP
ncbi:MAG: ACT domain-containing protein [Gammaproteobacteria bacterium]|nr:ACT domain-containing protein [Gammaproteobacteria bacterium]